MLYVIEDSNDIIESEIDSDIISDLNLSDELEFELDSDYDSEFVIASNPNANLDSDNVSREESEERINILLISWSIFVSIIAVTLLCLHPEKPKIIRISPEIKVEINRPKIPHILLIYYQGTTIDYVVHPKLSKSTQFGNFPDSDIYLPFYDNFNLYIAYGNGKLDTTKWLNGKHERLPNTKFPIGQVRHQLLQAISWPLDGAL